MKNKKVLIIISVLGVALLGLLFRNQLSMLFGGYTTTKSGMKYRFLVGSRLDKNLGPDKYMLIRYLLVGPEKDTIQNNYNADTLMEMPYPTEAHNELMEALQITGAGSTIEVLVKTDSLKIKIPGHPKVMAMKEGEWARFVLKVEKILSEEQFDAYQTTKRFTRIIAEDKVVDDYCAKNKKDWVLDSFKHFKYAIVGLKDQPRFNEGDEVEFHAEALTVNKSVLIINSRQEGRKYIATLGKHNYELPALDVLPTYLGEGESGEFVITSELGYGAAGRFGVPGYAPLIVRISDIHKVKK
jgi:hypothetical protein